MLHAVTVGLLLALASGGAEQAAQKPKTLWLTEPLYPGQEFVVARSEEALNRLMPLASRPDDLVGLKELAAFLQGKQPDLKCLAGEVPCSDPLDRFVGALGIERVVLMRGGQEEGAYRFQVASYVPATGQSLTAEGANAALDRALLGALVKVVPLASTIEVKSEPAGAVLFIDGEKVGATPFTGQILPGARALKLEAPSHMPVEKTLDVPVRGSVAVSEALEKVPARIVITALPRGTAILVDGQKLGVDKIDKPIHPAAHTIRLEVDGFHPHEEQADIKPGDTFTLEKTLEPTGWTSFKQWLKESEDDINGRKVFLQASFESWNLHSLSADGALELQSFSNSEFHTTKVLGTPGPLMGGSVGYGHEGRYFGLLAVGGGYFRSQSPWSYQVVDERDPETSIVERGNVDVFVVRALQPHLRLAVGKLVFMARAGAELRLTWLSVSDALVDQTSSGFVAADPMLTGQGLMRIFVFEGLFLEGGYRYGLSLRRFANSHGFHGGMGYAF